MQTTFKSFAVIIAFAAAAWAQIQLPTKQAAQTPGANAPQNSCFTETLPVHDYVHSVYWYCVPNTTPPTNLGTWTSYSLPTSVLALNASGQLVSATAAQVNALATNPAGLNGLTITATTGTLTIPAATTFTGPSVSGTAATLAGTETLTNKTIQSPVITGPTPNACGATCTAGAANVGGYIRMDTAAGSVVTLPTSTGSGTTYKIYVSVATTSAASKVLLTTVTDTIIGTAQGENAGTAKVFVGNAGTFHSIQMPFAGSQPSGGFIGDTITCTDVASTIWKCDMVYQAGTTPTTPYNAATT